MNGARIWLWRLASILVTVLFLWFMDGVVRVRFDALGGLDNRLIMLAAFFGTLAVSLNLINGITGQFSIGHAAFYAIGAYSTGFLTKNYFATLGLPEGVWLFLMVVVGGIFAGIAGLIVGLPTLRLRGDYLAVATLGFGAIVEVIIKSRDELGGPYGMSVSPKLTPMWLVLLWFILCVAMCRNVLKTAHGLPFLAVREDEMAASAMGVNTTRTKVTAFVLGAGMAGVAGSLFALYEGFITIKYFDMNQSFLILTMVVIGGTGSITGAAVAGVFLTLLPESLRDLPPVPAYYVFGFVFSAILAGVSFSYMRRRLGVLDSRGFLRVLQPLGVLGLIGLGLVGVTAGIGMVNKLLVGGAPGGAGSPWLWAAGLPVISSLGIALLSLGAVGFFLLASERSKYMAGLGWFLLGLGVAVVLTLGVVPLMKQVPLLREVLGDVTYQPGQLRFPFFALCLIFVMLSRPQGLFGHRELSWEWFRALWRREKPKPAVAV
jgi:branched-chain amino acid transport system permease protein